MHEVDELVSPSPSDDHYQTPYQVPQVIEQCSYGKEQEPYMAITGLGFDHEMTFSISIKVLDVPPTTIKVCETGYVCMGEVDVGAEHVVVSPLLRHILSIGRKEQSEQDACSSVYVTGMIPGLALVRIFDEPFYLFVLRQAYRQLFDEFMEEREDGG